MGHIARKEGEYVNAEEKDTDLEGRQAEPLCLENSTKGYGIIRPIFLGRGVFLIT